MVNRPSARNEKQIRAYNFLLDHARSRQSFTPADLATATEWTPVSVRTYISKQFRDYIEPLDGGYRTRIEFTRVSIEEFLRQTTQKRSVYSDYRRVKYDALVTYEFLLPLTREGELRRALDDLFYSDTMERRLRDIGLNNIEEIVPRDASFNDEQYIELVLSIVADRFQGYSISHVNGRFRAADLKSRVGAGELLAQDRTYLLDETTAIVRFIIKCNSSKSYYASDVQSILQAIDGEPVVNPASDEVLREIRLIRALFFQLFAEAVVRTVHGEEVIWLLEMGPTPRLYVWERAG